MLSPVETMAASTGVTAKRNNSEKARTKENLTAFLTDSIISSPNKINKWRKAKWLSSRLLLYHRAGDKDYRDVEASGRPDLVGSAAGGTAFFGNNKSGMVAFKEQTVGFFIEGALHGDDVFR